jgi:tRNA A37 threonylcarbamoyltransferase TsaD
MAPFLNAWLAAPDTVILNHHHINGHILQAVDCYNPETDVILLLESGGRASFLYLRNLPIPPHQSYEVVRRGWDEFKPTESDFSKT